jgi:hypothetical protein
VIDACGATPHLGHVEQNSQKVKDFLAQKQTAWSITPNETALLLVLQHRLLAHFLVIPPPTSSSTASGLCVLFFVEAGSAALGKRKKAEGGS